MKAIESAYNAIAESEVFRLDGPKIDLPAALITLGNAVHEYDGEEEIRWSLGEGNEATLDDLIVGAYWSLTEWHAGQSSDSYSAMCALGQVFNPGMSGTPEEGEPAHTAYELVGKWFEANSRPKTSDEIHEESMIAAFGEHGQG